MVVNEDTESINVSEVLLICLPSLSNSSHASSVHPNVTDGIIHRIVEETGDVVLVGANVSIISIEALTHLEDSGRLTILFPEVLGDLRDGINTDAIEAILLDQVLDPILQVLANVGVALVKIRKASESAVFNLPLIVPVVDVTIRVVVLSTVQRIDSRVVALDGCDVIGENVKHYPDAH